MKPMNSPDTLIADRVAGTASSAPVRAWYRRFTRTERILHAFLMLSFVACALTGLPLLFADRPWAPVLAQLLGGFRSAGVIHRIAATVMIGVFSTHLLMLVQRAVAKRNFLGMIWGPESMVPQPQDIIDIWNNFKWFVGRGPRPTFDRWTYWEKFDYWAVFWGMFIIGGSGLLLWFPFFFGKFIPGWMFNIAALIHGEEA
ncbi:MAG TPA: cytochrome b/b6 domain-containing protein, partial [Casimicrobiaceae bacterium]|nr:cytochrome b/b6 domain-containing protein [Casimicrobiaceae bacterium]